ncbi:hypothetical protein [Actinoplanes sp. NPDC049802]|uniref:hypothetical protein n=1 Tax=Actinoplanes sp. NPDC049802 TaxID=3154742 RepID=UPI0034020BD7
MAFRSWLKLLAATTTATAVVGAGQLGIAYGLGMVQLDQTLGITQRDQWTAQLAWVAWMTMTAAAIGAVVATGLRPRWSPRPVGAGGALAMGLAAGVGALAVLPLTMQPARAAQIAGVDAVLVIGICAALAAAVGIFAAAAAAAKAVARWSVTTLSLIVWTVALISVVPSLLPDKTPVAARLGVLEGALLPAAVTEHTPFVTMPVIALLTGLILGWVARGRGLPTLAVALSGLAGPALLTVAYLIAGPGTAAGFELSPYWAAMTAAGAGVLGSVLAAIIRSAPEPARPAEPESPTDDSPTDAKPEPASGRASLPRRDVPVQSAIAAAAAAAAQRPEDQLRPSDTGVFSVAVDDRPHPLRDLAAAGTAASPFTSGTGSPFGQGQPQPPVAGRASAPSPAVPAPAADTAAHPIGEPRFSGQEPAKGGVGAGLRRGWRTRRDATAAPVAATSASAALTGDSGSFNGFTTGQPGPRVGIDTAEHPRVASRAPLTPEPTPISAPLPHPQPIAPPPVAPAPAQRGRQGSREEDYVDWVNGLGN